MIFNPTPKNISTLWTFGSLLGLCLVVQIVTGLFLAMNYTADVNMAFDSVVSITRDVNNGWLIRYIHANGASLFFTCMYMHIGRGLYYGSFMYKLVWSIGVTLFFLSILTAFLGYVLPWGQMSYWAATVITNLISTIPYVGESIVIWLWGGFSVSNSTLVRFYALHFVLPFLLASLSLVHIYFLHGHGSSNPVGTSWSSWVNFHPYFSTKDLVGALVLWSVGGYLVFFNPNLLSDPENFIPANQLVTPNHIQPEWYFLPMYAILRSIPSKLGGVAALVLSIAVYYFYPYMRTRFFLFWYLVADFLLLGWLGSLPVEPPFEMVGRFTTIMYFILVFLA